MNWMDDHEVRTAF